MTPAELSWTVLSTVRRAVAEDELRVPVPEKVVVQRPPRPGCGDYATNVALQLAGAAGRSAYEVAAILAPRLAKEPGIAQVEIAGAGFLNITLSARAYADVVRQVREQGEWYGHGDGLAGLEVTVVPEPAEGVRARLMAEVVNVLLRATGARPGREEPLRVAEPADPATALALVHAAGASGGVDPALGPGHGGTAPAPAPAPAGADLGLGPEALPLPGGPTPALGPEVAPGAGPIPALGPEALPLPGGPTPALGPQATLGSGIAPGGALPSPGGALAPPGGATPLLAPGGATLGPDEMRWALLRPPGEDVPRLERTLLDQRESNPLFRVRYAHARTRALLRNAHDLGVRIEGRERDPYRHPAETELLGLVADFPRVVETAARRRAPDRVARHMERLGDAFLRFQDECPALPKGDEKPSAVHAARLRLADATGIVLAGGLHLLGISAPEHL